MDQPLETTEKQTSPQAFSKSTSLRLGLVVLAGLIYYFSNPKPFTHHNYTFLIAENLLRGKIGLKQAPPAWLNEMFAFEGLYYAAFPFGGVVTMLPFALFKRIGLINQMPSALIMALVASSCCLFLLLISQRHEIARQKQILLSLTFLFGTWMWTNVAMGGAWHLQNGFGVLGQLGAIYFILYRRNPFLAGCFFALAFGNRTEILLTAPLLMFLLVREGFEWKRLPNILFAKRKALILFCLIPFALGIGTLAYNYLRFHSPLDFGYTYSQGVLDYWYRYGTHSIWYIPRNVQEMLITRWKTLAGFPYLVPTGFGGAIWLSSPFLIYLFRWRVRDRIVWRTSWLAIIIITLSLWTHGSPGGWQFSYRYGMELLPWVFLILLENSPRKITVGEWLLCGYSCLVNAWATYLFLWTQYVKP